MAKSKKTKSVSVEKPFTLDDNKSLVSMSLRRIADEFDTLVMVNDHIIKENTLLEREVQILLKELNYENSPGIRNIIRAKATLVR